MEDFGLDVAKFASCTTDSGSDVKSMCVNHANRVGIKWDWCISHMANKACEHAFGTSADPAKSKNPRARDLLQKVIKVVQRLNKSSTWRAKFEDIQVKPPGEMSLGFLLHSAVPCVFHFVIPSWSDVFVRLKVRG